jgi:Ca2+-binding RTX toxin-like protein
VTDGKGDTVSLFIDPAADYTGETFTLASDRGKGTDVAVMSGTTNSGGLGSGGTGSSGGAVNVIKGPAGGFAVINGTSENDQITAFKVGNVINGKGGNDVINAGSGTAVVNLGNGNSTVTLGGSSNVVTGGTGSTTVSGAAGGRTTVTLGDGNDTVNLGGSGDVVKLGTGADSVMLTGGLGFISTGGGNDTITIAGSGNTVNAGGDNNTISGGTGKNTFVIPGAGAGTDTIAGFTDTNGDVLDLRSALASAGWKGNQSTLPQYLKVGASAGSTTLSIAKGGSGAGQLVATLSGTGTLTLADLQSHHSLLLM